MHFSCVVIVLDAGGPESVVRTAKHLMEPYDENAPVRRGREVAMSQRELAEMRKGYADVFGRNLNLQELAAELEGWNGGRNATVHNGTLYYEPVRNPDGKYDYFELGGRAHGVYGEDDVFALKDTPRFWREPPFALVLPDGKWLGQTFILRVSQVAWRTAVGRAASRWRDTGIGVLFDCHI